MAGRTRAGCSTGAASAPDVLRPQNDRSAHLCDNYMLVFIVPASAVLLGVILMFWQNGISNQVLQKLVEVHSEMKTYLDTVKTQKEQQEFMAQKITDISEALPKVVVIFSRLRKEIKEEMTVRLEQGVVLSPKSYAEIKMLMQSQLETYDCDKTGLTDYALGLAGGKILSTKDTETYAQGAPVLSFLGMPLCTQSNKAYAILETSVMPGECWAVKGERATAVIQLIAKIYVTNVSLEHIPKGLSPTGEIDSAPKEFSIWGLTDASSKKGAHFFGQFVYLKDGSPLQTFPVQTPSNSLYDIVEFRLHSNHGHIDYTCIYRIRIHGKMSGSHRQNNLAT